MLITYTCLWSFVHGKLAKIEIKHNIFINGGVRLSNRVLVTSLSFTHRPHAVREFVIAKTFYYCSYKL